MFDPSDLAFPGSGLNRAAELRKDHARIAGLMRTGRILPLWRGKPLAENSAALAYVPAGSPVLAHASETVFLGFDGVTPCFAADISDWSPEAGAEAVEAGFQDQSQQHHPALPAGQTFVELRSFMTALSPREAELAATAKALLHWHRSHRFCSACGQPSLPAMAGWQRSCPACAASHFPRTDPVVIMLVTNGDSLLLGRSPGWPEGMYSCLAGFVEPGETIESAVRREVAEEAGIRIGGVRLLVSQPWPFPASLMIGCLAEAASTEITLDPEEIEDVVWVSRTRLLQIHAGTDPRIRPPRKGAIAQVLIANWLAGRLD
jgi:NAD+ diphosphatase